MADTWDVIVIGGGPAGENAAQYAIADSSRSAVIVEAERLGGECSYWACMPSKALLRPVEVLAAAAGLPGLTVSDRLDTDAVLARRDAFVSGLDDSGQVDWARGLGIDVVRGHGRLVGERAVEVATATGTRLLHARRAVVLATGSSAAVPDVPGLRAALPWTSRDATSVREVPGSVVIIGGGVVACEAAVWLRALGSRVTVLAGGGLLTRFEPFAGELVAARFAELGIDVRPVRAQRVERARTGPAVLGRPHGGSVTVRLAADGDEGAGGRSLVADEVLVAAGRVPASADLGLDSVGLSPDPSGCLPTDAHQTVAAVPGAWLYAVGDVTGRSLLTHQGKYQARIAGAVIAARAGDRERAGGREGAGGREDVEGGDDVATADIDHVAAVGVGPSRRRNLVDGRDGAAVPQVVFTDPQVASVGLTEQQARRSGIDVEILDDDLGSVAGAALLRDGYTGRARLVVDRAAEVVVGATFVGPEVAELLHAATIAVVARVPLSVLWHAVPAYPTVSEVWLRLLESRKTPYN